MKTKQLLFMTIVLFLGTISVSYSQCATCTDNLNVISHNGSGSFTASNAQAYFWEVCEGNAVIIGSNTTQSINLDCSGMGLVKVKVTRFLNGNCLEACESFVCTPNNECNYSLGILDEYIDGTQSGANWVYLQAGGNFPNGTVYTWTTKRQSGLVQSFTETTQNPRKVWASINNRITEATVTATFENCTKTVTKRFRCAIPNADINGNLFSECNFIAGLGLSKAEGKIKVFPNPTKSKVAFEGKNLNKYKITITDFIGNVIVKENSLNKEINLNKEKSGIYYYIISDNKGNSQEGKIIKE